MSASLIWIQKMVYSFLSFSMRSRAVRVRSVRISKKKLFFIEKRNIEKSQKIITHANRSYWYKERKKCYINRLVSFTSYPLQILYSVHASDVFPCLNIKQWYLRFVRNKFFEYVSKNYICVEEKLASKLVDFHLLLVEEKAKTFISVRIKVKLNEKWFNNLENGKSYVYQGKKLRNMRGIAYGRCFKLKKMFQPDLWRKQGDIFTIFSSCKFLVLKELN